MIPKSGEPDTVRERAGADQLCAGVAGESGQLIELIKEYTFHGDELDRDRLIDEMGDVLWYLSRLAEWAKIPFSEVARAKH